MKIQILTQNYQSKNFNYEVSLINQKQKNPYQSSFGSVWRGGKKVKFNEEKMIKIWIQRIIIGRENRQFLTTITGGYTDGYRNACNELNIPLDKVFNYTRIFKYNPYPDKAFIISSQARRLTKEDGGHAFIRPIFKIEDVVHSKDFGLQTPVGFAVSDGKNPPISYINAHAKESPFQQIYKKIFDLIMQIDYKFRT